MKRRIVLIGASGVFGARLASLLAPCPDVTLVLAARHEAPLIALRERMGRADVEIAVFDRRRPEALAALSPWAVADAAGPFQGAGYDLALAAVSAGAHYVDLADGRDFVAGFEAAVDEAARRNGALAVTGASSTPALTHAALGKMTADWKRIDRVSSAICTGARAPRGASLVRAILSWTGQPVRCFADGAWRQRPGWSGLRRVSIPGIGTRWAGLAETADLDLMPARYHPTREALFMAGLEPPVLQWGLWLLAWPVRLGLVRSLEPLAGLLGPASGLVAWMGSDRSGMVVEAEGAGADGEPRHSRWALVAEPGAGPTTPAAPAAAVLLALLDGTLTATGATTCAGLLPLKALIASLAGLPITTRLDEALPSSTGLFPRVLGAVFDMLPPQVRAAHHGASTVHAEGQAVARGANGLAALVRAVLGLPGRGRHAAAVEIAPRNGEEVWTRHFGRHRFCTRLRPVHGDPGAFEETAWPISFRFRADPCRGGFRWRLESWRLGPLPLPRLLAPAIRARTFAHGGAYRFSVLAAHPVTGVLFAYAGRLTLK